MLRCPRARGPNSLRPSNHPTTPRPSGLPRGASRGVYKLLHLDEARNRRDGRVDRVCPVVPPEEVVRLVPSRQCPGQRAMTEGRGADGSAAIPRSRCHEEPLEGCLPQDHAVHHAVEAHPSSGAEVAVSQSARGGPGRGAGRPSRGQLNRAAKSRQMEYHSAGRVDRGGSFRYQVVSISSPSSLIRTNGSGKDRGSP